jgi:flagellar hook protein FlgE
MSLYGALFAGVSGLNAQSRAIGNYSDNITNVNTVGFKASSANFATLITGSGDATGSSSGGVKPISTRLIDQQGSVQNTGISSDLAISGQGFFVVSDKAEAHGAYMFTRAGGFRADQNGNYVNGSGFVLQGWPLDSEGRLPGEPGNLNTTSNALLDSLTPINVRFVSGAVASTSKVKLGLNLDAREKILEGAGQSLSAIATSTTNASIGLNDLIVPNATLTEGANIKVGIPSNTYTYTYGGVRKSTDISTGVFGASNASSVFTGATAGDSFTITNSAIGTLTFTYVPNAPDTLKGQFNNLNTLADAMSRASGTSARVSGNNLYISATDASQGLTFADVTGTFKTALGLTNIAAATTPLTNDGVAKTGDITGTILGAATVTADFTGATNGDNFTIVTTTGGTETFTYNSPAGAGQFSTLTELAALLNTSTGVKASIDNNILYISPVVATETMTFADVAGTFVAALGLTSTTADAGTVKRFATLQGLADLVNQSPGIKAKADGQLSSGSVKIYNKDPLQTIWYDYGYPATGLGNLLTEFGVTRNSPTTLPAVTVTGPAYDPQATNAGNMAAGKVTSQFSRNVEVFDPLGTRHDFQVSFVKLDINKWGVEFYCLKPGDLQSSRTDGLVASGTVLFNGDGTLRSVSPSLTSDITMQWSNGANPNNVSFNWGTAGEPSGTPGATQIGLKDGLQQIASSYDVQFVETNGVSAALLSSIDIDKNGFVIANYTNGLSQQLYKIPLADFPNNNALTALDGNVFTSNQNAGDYNLKTAGSGGVGTIKSGALEQANVELADELTKLVIAQRSYEANTQIISATNDLLMSLSRLFK